MDDIDGDVTQPRLGIIHLMTWTLGSAAILGISRLFEEGPNPYREILLVYRVLYSFVGGAAIGGVLIFFGRLTRGGPAFPAAPGHYLLLLEGTMAIVRWLGYGALRAWEASQSDTLYIGPGAYAAMHCWVALAFAIGAIFCRAGCRRPLHWSLVFTLIALLHCLTLLMALVMLFVWSAWGTIVIIELGVAGVIAVAILIGVAIDFGERERRDWLHWTGVVVSLTGIAMAFGLRFALQLQNNYQQNN